MTQLLGEMPLSPAHGDHDDPMDWWGVDSLDDARRAFSEADQRGVLTLALVTMLALVLVVATGVLRLLMA